MCGQRGQGVSQHDTSRTALFLRRTKRFSLAEKQSTESSVKKHIADMGKNEGENLL